MTGHPVAQGQAFRAEGWLTLENPAMTMDEARLELEQRGNVIIEVDEERRRFKVLDTVLIAHAGTQNDLDNLEAE